MKTKHNLDNCLITEKKYKQISKISKEMIGLARSKYPHIKAKMWSVWINCWSDDDFEITLRHGNKKGLIDFVFHKGKIREIVKSYKIKIVKRKKSCEWCTGR